MKEASSSDERARIPGARPPPLTRRVRLGGAIRCSRSLPILLKSQSANLQSRRDKLVRVLGLTSVIIAACTENPDPVLCNFGRSCLRVHHATATHLENPTQNMIMDISDGCPAAAVGTILRPLSIRAQEQTRRQHQKVPLPQPPLQQASATRIRPRVRSSSGRPSPRTGWGRERTRPG